MYRVFTECGLGLRGLMLWSWLLDFSQSPSEPSYSSLLLSFIYQTRVSGFFHTCKFIYVLLIMTSKFVSHF